LPVRATTEFLEETSNKTHLSRSRFKTNTSRHLKLLLHARI
jgi:hypothetical protein